MLAIRGLEEEVQHKLDVAEMEWEVILRNVQTEASSQLVSIVKCTRATQPHRMDDTLFA